MYSKLVQLLKQKVSLTALIASTAITGCVSVYAPVDGLSIKIPKNAQISPELKEQLKFIDEVKAYETYRFGLNDGPHYREYNDGSMPAETLYMLFITPPTALPDSQNWNYIYLETKQEYRDSLDSLIYFYSYADTLEDEKEYYQQQGYDVYHRFTTNFNLKERGSPITEEFLQRSKIEQAQTILHEDCHYWVSASIGENFSRELDESFCQVIGYSGAIDYFGIKEGVNSPNYQSAVNSFQWYTQYAQQINSCYGRLQEIYNNPRLTQEEKLKQRKEVFDGIKWLLGETGNNAALWGRYPYTKYFPMLLKFHEHNGGNVRATLEKMKVCPKDEPSALEFIIKNSSSKD
ncbi:MAG: aminopeptidase [Nanoarchaeota archaeon]